MPLPRVPKIEKTLVDRSEAPDWKVTPDFQDPYRLGPEAPWLRVVYKGIRIPDELERLEADTWIVEGPGVWRVHTYLASDRAIVSQDQSRLMEMRRDGTRTVLWEGPKLIETAGGGLWGDNWMFAAASLPDGRWVCARPNTEAPDRDARTWVQELVLYSADNRPLATLPVPERTDSEVKKHRPRRYMVREIHPACDGRVVVLHHFDALVVGVYDDRLEYVGKTSMPREGGAVYIDGTDALVSSAMSNQNPSWHRLEGLEALWEKRR